MKAVSFLQAFGKRQSIGVCPRPGETGEKVIGLAALLPAKEIYAMHVTALLQKTCWSCRRRGLTPLLLRILAGS